ncbi:MAG TPA: rubrerythrin [Desulfobacteraceae bacterium]|nr:rubrerythrin [Desulfobacteraceae bacterium]
MTFGDFREVVEFAIEKEKEAVSFYEDASAQQKFSDARKMFKDFANEERKHQALLEGFLRGEKTTADYDLKWIPDMKRSNYLVDISYEKGMSYADILRLAMKREEKALTLYNDLAREIDDKDLEQTFKMLSQEEAKHKLALETLYDDYMAEMGD